MQQSPLPVMHFSLTGRQEYILAGVIFSWRLCHLREGAMKKKNRGWFHIHREIEDKRWYRKPNYLALFIHLNLKATHAKREVFFKGKPITLLPGQLITGRKALSRDTGISESSCERILTYFEKIEHQIEQQKSNQNRLITILSWHDVRECEQQNGQRVDNGWTTDGQPLDTNKNDKNDENEKKIKHNSAAAEIIDYLNQKTGKKYRHAKAHLSVISARLKEGFTLEDCKRVIDIKTAQWLNDEKEKYLRPETLFRPSKFEGYLNERERGGNNQQSIFQVTDDDQEALERMIKGG
jgi:uncharacterized phage protein (TIGR02220 family)